MQKSKISFWRTAVVGLIASLCLGTFGQVGSTVFADGAGNLPDGYVATDSLTSEDKFNKPCARSLPPLSRQA